MEKTAPIGVFDSGVGGLGTLKALQKQLPHENFVFYGDNANAPYGTKETERILSLIHILTTRNPANGVRWTAAITFKRLHRIWPTFYAMNTICL